MLVYQRVIQWSMKPPFPAVFCWDQHEATSRWASGRRGGPTLFPRRAPGLRSLVAHWRSASLGEVMGLESHGRKIKGPWHGRFWGPKFGTWFSYSYSYIYIIYIEIHKPLFEVVSVKLITKWFQRCSFALFAYVSCVVRSWHGLPNRSRAGSSLQCKATSLGCSLWVNIPGWYENPGTSRDNLPWDHGLLLPSAGKASSTCLVQRIGVRRLGWRGRGNLPCLKWVCRFVQIEVWKNGDKIIGTMMLIPLKHDFPSNFPISPFWAILHGCAVAGEICLWPRPALLWGRLQLTNQGWFYQEKWGFYIPVYQLTVPPYVWLRGSDMLLFCLVWSQEMRRWYPMPDMLF